MDVFCIDQYAAILRDASDPKLIVLVLIITSVDLGMVSFRRKELDSMKSLVHVIGEALQCNTNISKS